MTIPGKVLRRVRSDDGTATVEATLWLPVYTLAIVLILDATFIFKGEARVHSIVQDGARQYVLGAYAHQDAPEAALEDWIETRLADTGISRRSEARVTMDSDGELTATVRYPSADTDLSGVTGLLAGLTMQVTIHYLTEY